MNKLEITESVIIELKLKIKFNLALRSWWWPDYGLTQNMRLTKPGLKFVRKVVKGHTFDFDFENTGMMLKRLAKLETPFYVDQDGITIFSEKLVTMIKMYPNFNRYLELIDGNSK